MAAVVHAHLDDGDHGTDPPSWPEAWEILDTIEDLAKPMVRGVYRHAGSEVLDAIQRAREILTALDGRAGKASRANGA